MVIFKSICLLVSESADGRCKESGNPVSRRVGSPQHLHRIRIQEDERDRQSGCLIILGWKKIAITSNKILDN